ncbi:hypothetical protein scyTo_0022899 [Scyliorhinus torazame]|uniref:Uncharacterized protein n=1 Tax=Scyliorhinus torazame TaxID=75743 RepID=A0A401QAF9_SCYTO|nr:hypothetical protein [Scyliorhinus torazame]
MKMRSWNGIERGKYKLTDLDWVDHRHDFNHIVIGYDVALEPPLNLSVKFHEADVGDVAREQEDTLPPLDHIVQEEYDQQDQVQNVEGDIPEQGPPGQVQHFPGEDGAHSDHKQDVEHSRSHNGANAHVTVGNEDSDERGEEFRGRPPCRHERGPRHIVRNVKSLDDLP